jgi:hypothetical protein
MHVSEAVYDETTALTVDWDLQMADVEQRVQKTLQDRANA